MNIPQHAPLGEPMAPEPCPGSFQAAGRKVKTPGGPMHKCSECGTLFLPQEEGDDG